jgi:hypothetical protein
MLIAYAVKPHVFADLCALQVISVSIRLQFLISKERLLWLAYVFTVHHLYTRLDFPVDPSDSYLLSSSWSMLRLYNEDQLDKVVSNIINKDLWKKICTKFIMPRHYPDLSSQSQYLDCILSLLRWKLPSEKEVHDAEDIKKNVMTKLNARPLEDFADYLEMS